MKGSIERLGQSKNVHFRRNAKSLALECGCPDLDGFRVAPLRRDVSGRALPDLLFRGLDPEISMRLNCGIVFGNSPEWSIA